MAIYFQRKGKCHPNDEGEEMWKQKMKILWLENDSETNNERTKKKMEFKVYTTRLSQTDVNIYEIQRCVPMCSLFIQLYLLWMWVEFRKSEIFNHNLKMLMFKWQQWMNWRREKMMKTRKRREYENGLTKNEYSIFWPWIMIA